MTGKKKNGHSFLGSPNWLGIGTIVAILTFLVVLVVYKNELTNGLLNFATSIRNTIRTPLSITLVILSCLSLLAVFLYRHEGRKVKVGTWVLLLFSLGGFIVASLYPMPQDTTLISELTKGKEALQKELLNSKETIRQKENANALLTQQKEKLTKGAETLRQQDKTNGDRIQQIQNENALLKQENAKLGKEVDTINQQNKKYADTIQKKGDENNLLKQQNENLAKDIETQKQQNKTHGDVIQKKDKEILDLNGQLSEARNKASLLEKGNRELQTQVSNLKKSTKTPIFECADNKLFMIDGDDKKELFTEYKIKECSISKTAKKIASIGYKDHYHLIVFNADRNLSDKSVWHISDHSSSEDPRNLKWVSDTVLRIYLIESVTIQIISGRFVSKPSGKLTFENALLKGTGTYEITIDETNSLKSIKKLDIGS